MSYKLVQFPPQASTRAMRVPMRWMGLDGCMSGSGFLNSWLEAEDFDAPRGQLNWGAVAGLAISLVISGGFWAGLGVLAARFLR